MQKEVPCRHLLPFSLHWSSFATQAGHTLAVVSFQTWARFEFTEEIQELCLYALSIPQSQLRPEVVKVDVCLLSLGKHVSDEAFSLSRLGTGQKHFAHSVGHFWLVP